MWKTKGIHSRKKPWSSKSYKSFLIKGCMGITLLQIITPFFFYLKNSVRCPAYKFSENLIPERNINHCAVLSNRESWLYGQTGHHSTMGSTTLTWSSSPFGIIGTMPLNFWGLDNLVYQLCQFVSTISSKFKEKNGPVAVLKNQAESLRFCSSQTDRFAAEQNAQVDEWLTA